MRMVCRLAGGDAFAAEAGGFTATSATGAASVISSPLAIGAYSTSREGQTLARPSSF